MAFMARLWLGPSQPSWKSIGRAYCLAAVGSWLLNQPTEKSVEGMELNISENLVFNPPTSFVRMVFLVAWMASGWFHILH